MGMILASIQKRKSKNGKARFRVFIRHKGHPPITATFSTKTEAKQWAQKTEVALQEKRYPVKEPPKERTISDLIDHYLENVLPSQSRDTNNSVFKLRWWKKQLGYCFLSDLSPLLIMEKRNLLLKSKTYKGTKFSPSTVNRYLAALSHVLTLAVKEWGWLDESPMKRVRKLKEPRGIVRFLSNGERKRFLKACEESSNPYIYTIVILALSTGMRRAEIMNLRWERVDLDRGIIFIEETKNGDRRSVPLRGKAFKVIQEFKAMRKQDFGLLFPSPRFKNQPFDLRRLWFQMLKKSGIKNFRFHDMRHSAASYLAMSGATPLEITEVLGHRTLQMVKRYAHISEQHSAKVIEKMNEKFFG